MQQDAPCINWGKGDWPLAQVPWVSTKQEEKRYLWLVLPVYVALHLQSSLSSCCHDTTLSAANSQRDKYVLLGCPIASPDLAELRIKHHHLFHTLYSGSIRLKKFITNELASSQTPKDWLCLYMSAWTAVPKVLEHHLAYCVIFFWLWNAIFRWLWIVVAGLIGLIDRMGSNALLLRWEYACYIRKGKHNWFLFYMLSCDATDKVASICGGDGPK